MTGTTVGATNDYTSLVCDAPASTGPDIVYALVLAAAGTFEFTLDNTSTWNASAYLRNPTCADQTSGKFCYDQDPLQELDLRHLEAGTYYLVIDGANDSSGPFTLSASLSAPVCGDGAVNPGEQCDDGNAVAMDGCTNCNPDAVPPATNICPGSPFTISTGMTLAISGDNCGATDDYKSLGTQCQPEVGGRDQVYQITPLQSGNLTAVVGTLSDKVTSICATNGMSAECWDHALYLRSACDATVDDTLDCTDAPDIETIGPVPVVANVPYWLVIDGYDAEFYSCGPYTIYVDLQ